mgnify:CR=1 FL=1
MWISVKEVINEGAVKVWRKLKPQLNSHSLLIDKPKLDEYLDRLSALEKIKEYHYPVMIIHTDDYEEITESFIRVNSRGTRLREAELAMAQLAFHWPGALVKEFEGALEEYEQANYDLEARFLMRCFVAVSTNQSRSMYLSALWKKSPTELKVIWRRTKKAVDHTINFLRNNAGIESSDWIPSINALALRLSAFYQVSVDWVKAFTNFASFRFADTLNTRSAELTAEALPSAITSSRPGVCKNFHLASNSVCSTH